MQSEIHKTFNNLSINNPTINNKPKIETEQEKGLLPPAGRINSRVRSDTPSYIRSAIEANSLLANSISSFDRKNLSYTLQESLPKLIRSVSFGGAGRIIHNSLDRYALAHNVELTMLDGTTLCALDNINKHSKPGFTTNCYGFALTSGQYWVTQRQLLNWMENQTLYTLREGDSGKVGDLVLWRSEEIGIEHAAILTAPQQVTMAAGIYLYDGMQTTTVTIEQGWNGRNCKIQYWGLSSDYYSLAKGNESSYKPSSDTPKIISRQMKDPPASKETRLFQRGLEP